ncbi:MAG: flagellar protein FliO/FliZ [Marinobacter psychrophilus]|jgi:flagellar protein FliO/FliZ
MTSKFWQAVPVFWLMVAFPTMAEPVAPQAQLIGATRTPDTLSTLVSLGLGLLAVIAIIYGCAWLIRRMTGMTGMNNSAIKVVSVMALGARERIAVVDVAGQQLLLGITPSTISTLHVFDKPVVSVGGSAPSGEFARKLQSLMNKTQAPNVAADSSGRSTNDRKI